MTLLGTVPQERIPELIGASDVVCQPSLVEPFGQALLEAMACGRPVVATRIGGPPEFVPPEAGILVDPCDELAVAAALRAAAWLPCPNPAARAAAERHDVKRQAERIEAVLERASRGRPLLAQRLSSRRREERRRRSPACSAAARRSGASANRRRSLP